MPGSKNQVRVSQIGKEKVVKVISPLNYPNPPIDYIKRNRKNCFIDKYNGQYYNQKARFNN